jgi:hypothetical protein
MKSQLMGVERRAYRSPVCANNRRPEEPCAPGTRRRVEQCRLTVMGADTDAGRRSGAAEQYAHRIGSELLRLPRFCSPKLENQLRPALAKARVPQVERIACILRVQVARQRERVERWACAGRGRQDRRNKPETQRGRRGADRYAH